MNMFMILVLIQPEQLEIRIPQLLHGISGTIQTGSLFFLTQRYKDKVEDVVYQIFGHLIIYFFHLTLSTINYRHMSITYRTCRCPLSNGCDVKDMRPRCAVFIFQLAPLTLIFCFVGIKLTASIFLVWRPELVKWNLVHMPPAICLTVLSCTKCIPLLS